MRKIAALVRQPPATADNFATTMREALARAYPQKSAYVGEDALSALVFRGIAKGHDFNFSSDRSLALVILLMFTLGHGCCEDPLHPWIAQALADKTAAGPEALAVLLKKRTLAWLARAQSQTAAEVSE